MQSPARVDNIKIKPTLEKRTSTVDLSLEFLPTPIDPVSIEKTLIPDPPSPSRVLKETLEDEQQNPTDFIAAARRAAQAAANEANSITDVADKEPKSGKS